MLISQLIVCACICTSMHAYADGGKGREQVYDCWDLLDIGHIVLVLPPVVLSVQSVPLGMLLVGVPRQHQLVARKNHCCHDVVLACLMPSLFDCGTGDKMKVVCYVKYWDLTPHCNTCRSVTIGRMSTCSKKHRDTLKQLPDVHHPALRAARISQSQITAAQPLTKPSL